jgi:hypothetical protein
MRVEDCRLKRHRAGILPHDQHTARTGPVLQSGIRNLQPVASGKG